MNILQTITSIVTLVAVLMSLKRDLMMLQQNSNRNDRYLRWMKQSGDSTRISRLMAIIVAFTFLVKFGKVQVSVILALVFSAIAIINLYRAKYKKPLVYTHRAIRIYSTSIVLMLIAVGAISVVSALNGGSWMDYCIFALMVSYAVSYLYIMSANWLLKPIEKAINRKYYNEAAEILKSMPGLRVIGITGSYGKTSTKHYLHRILSEKYDVLMTPGNFNTTLGVIRTVREHMKPYNQVFIAEMGAKQSGDIKEICDLVHPQMGIITAVGPQHLESFKTIEGVQATKFELADAIPGDGLVVLNDDFEYIANRPVDNTHSARYAVDNVKAGDYYAKDIEYSQYGTHFTVVTPEGKEIKLFTHLVGKCNISNLLAAVIIALRMGVSDDKIRYAVEKIQQVEHRLTIKRTPAGITIIDDAYNSNPVGAAMALEVLANMKGGKRIIITPGMIELGSDQYRLNKEYGEEIARAADLVIIVGEYNREAINEGLAEASYPQAQIHLADTFAQAQQYMLSVATAGDTVLYENDLPDTFK